MRISDWSSDVCSSDLLAFNAADLDEVISSGRSLDYAEKIYLTTGDTLYSNRSNPQLEIVEDSVGRHDFLLTPCSVDTFRHFYPDEPEHRGCFGNLAAARAPYGVVPDRRSEERRVGREWFS